MSRCWSVGISRKLAGMDSNSPKNGESTLPNRNVVRARMSSLAREILGIRNWSSGARWRPWSYTAGFSSLCSKKPLWVYPQGILQLVLEKALVGIPLLLFRLVLEEAEIQLLHRLAGLLGELRADPRRVFEGADLVATGAAVASHQLPPALGKLRIVHERRVGIGGVGVLKRHEIGSDVARFLGNEAQAGHHRHVLDLELGAVVGTLRVFQVENERQSVFGVILRTQVFGFARTVGASALPWVVDPAHHVVITVLFTHPGEVGGEISAHPVAGLAHRMAGQKAARLKQLLAARGIAGLLLRRRWTGPSRLPHERGERADLVAGEAERRHLRARAKSLRILQPDRNPFLAQFEPDVFKIGADLLDVLHQELGFRLHFGDPGVNVAGADTQIFSGGEVLFRVFVGVGAVAQLDLAVGLDACVLLARRHGLDLFAGGG